MKVVYHLIWFKMFVQFWELKDVFNQDVLKKVHLSLTLWTLCRCRGDAVEPRASLWQELFRLPL